MNKEHLMNNPALFAYETSKYFVRPERLLKHYTCSNEIVILSTKRLYIYFFTTFIDVYDELLTKLDLTESKSGCKVVIRGKEFDLQFKTDDEFKSFMNYYNEFKLG